MRQRIALGTAAMRDRAYFEGDKGKDHRDAGARKAAC